MPWQGHWQVKMTKHQHQQLAYLIGTGLALSPIHNQWLTNITSINGQATLFLPAIAPILWILGALFFLRDHWPPEWDDKRVYIPLLIIAGAIALSGITSETWGGKVAPLGMAVAMVGLYLASPQLGTAVFVPLAIGSVIASVGIIVQGVIAPGTLTGGLVFERNYEISAAYVLLGAALYRGRWQMPIIALSLVTVFISGAPEGILAICALGVVVIIRRDWGKRLLLAVTPFVVVVVVWFGLGWGQQLYDYAFRVVQGQTIVHGGVPENSAGFLTEDNTDLIAVDNTAVEWRLTVARYALQNLKPLGDGYNLTAFTTKTVHNVPLIIVQQLGYPGILAGLAWLVVSLWMLIKTEHKYLWAIILAYSLFDHSMWDQLGAIWWLAAGTSMAYGGSKWLFRQGSTTGGGRGLLAPA